jgi:hypothetical protein
LRCVLGEYLARGGERNAAAEPFEEIRAQFLLNLAYLGADGWLRAKTCLSGLGKALQPDNFQESVELIEVRKTVQPS